MFLILIGIVICILSLFMYYRNNKVKEFCLFVLHMDEPSISLKYYYKLPSYNKMLYSFKKLRLETYFTEKEIKELKIKKEK